LQAGNQTGQVHGIDALYWLRSQHGHTHREESHMKVLLRQNVYKLGKIGEVIDVRDGYARNYLLPYGIAYQPTEANLKRVEDEKQRYLEELAKQRAEIEARAAVVQGKEITIAARANEEGHLYGSVGPAQIASILAEDNIFVEVRDIDLGEPIRQLDKYDVKIRFNEDISATIHVWIVPTHEEGEDEFAGSVETPASESAEETDE